MLSFIFTRLMSEFFKCLECYKSTWTVLHILLLRNCVVEELSKCLRSGRWKMESKCRRGYVVNDGDSYDNNSMLVLTFTALTISGRSRREFCNDKQLQGSQPYLSLSGDDVPGGEEAGPQGPGGSQRAGEVTQSHQDHRFRPSAAAGRRREGVQRGWGQGWCKSRTQHGQHHRMIQVTHNGFCVSWGDTRTILELWNSI